MKKNYSASVLFVVIGKCTSITTEMHSICTCHTLHPYSEIDVNNIYRFMIMAHSEYLFVIIMHHRIIYCMTVVHSKREQFMHIVPVSTFTILGNGESWLSPGQLERDDTTYCAINSISCLAKIRVQYIYMRLPFITKFHDSLHIDDKIERCQCNSFI